MYHPIFDSRDPLCKRPFGAVPAGERVTFSIRLEKAGTLHSPTLSLCRADCWDTPLLVPMAFTRWDSLHNWYSCVFAPPEPELYFYSFLAKDGEENTVFIKRAEDNTGMVSPKGEGGLWQLTVYAADFSSSDLLKGALIYQVFPDRFQNSGTPKKDVPADRRIHGSWGEMPAYLPDEQGNYQNNDYFGGDLQGILEKLPYLQELGVTVLYLNPIFEAHSNHRYNTGDYHKIDPLLGSEKDFSDLCRAAGELGISILLDGVFSHTGSDSIYFNREGRYPKNGACDRLDSPYLPWYQFQHYPDRYKCWWGFETLPEIREVEPTFTSFLCGEQGVLAHWMNLGASGWRLDVADELPDETIGNIRKAVKRTKASSALVGEVWEDASNKVSYGERRRYLLGQELDSVMNYPFRDGILRYITEGNGAAFYETVMQILENYPKPVVDALMTSLSTHDTVRALTALTGEPLENHDRSWQAEHHLLERDSYLRGVELLKLAAVLQYTLPGSPCLYYGDEAGLTGYKDPFNRACYPWGQEDARLVAFFKELGALRKSLPCLREGGFVPITFTDEICSYVREDCTGGVLVAVNRSTLPVSLTIPGNPLSLLFGELEGGVLPAMRSAVLALS